MFCELALVKAFGGQQRAENDAKHAACVRSCGAAGYGCGLWFLNALRGSKIHSVNARSWPREGIRFSVFAACCGENCGTALETASNKRCLTWFVDQRKMRLSARMSERNQHLLMKTLLHTNLLTTRSCFTKNLSFAAPQAPQCLQLNKTVCMF